MTGASALPSLKIGDLIIEKPIIQGGMGVRVSASRLASAVSNEGCLGVVAAVATGEEWHEKSLDYPTRSYRSFRALLQEAKALTSGPIGVNIMCATKNYDSLVGAAVEENVAAIICGAGLPLRLPALVPDRHIKLIPVVSSGRAADLICRTWQRKYDRLPDAFIVEGPLAGGHLGFDPADLENLESTTLESCLAEVLSVIDGVAEATGTRIPVIAAGGIFNGQDIVRFLRLGASGVQMGTRFVCTHECDADIAYKEAYLKCTKEDIILVKSPVGLPLRVIRNGFIDRVSNGVKYDVKCHYRCLHSCNPTKTNYCIAQALMNAYRGDLENGFTTCGANAYRIDKIVSVRELVKELVDEAEACLANA